MQVQTKQKRSSTLNHNQELKNKCKSKPQLMSINHLIPEQKGSQCNYCHKGTSYSNGLINKDLSSYTYLVMMQRGWRRCGTYYYKLDLQKSCCKQWTHRLNVNNFKIKKDQKKTIKKMITLCYEPVAIQQQKKEQKPKKQKQKPISKITLQVNKYYKEIIYDICSKINQELKNNIKTLINEKFIQSFQFNFQFLNNLKFFTSPSTSNSSNQKANYYCNYGMLVYGCNKKYIKTKDYPLTEFIKDIKQFVQSKGNCQKYNIQLQRTGYLLIYLSDSIKLEKSQEFQIIAQEKIEPKIQKISLQKKDPPLNQNKNLQGQSFFSKIKQKVQKVFHKELQKDPAVLEHKVSSNKFQVLEPSYKGQIRITTDLITFGKLSIKLVKAEENKQSFNLYNKYCQQIHEKPQKSMSSYTNFLCEKALVYEEFSKKHSQDDQYQKYYIPSFDPSQKYQKRHLIQNEVKLKLGCYHMKYYLENKLIAIGVVDILPTGLSSVYFFYEPQYKNYRLGVFSSLIEIEYVRYLQLSFPQFKNYYMGFYIHNNQKMSYKGDYQPYELLCPITYNFIPVDERVKQKIHKIVMEGQKNIRLADQSTALQDDMNFGMDLGVYIDKNIRLTYKNRPLKLKEINPSFFIPVLTLLKTYINLWGKQVFDIFTFTF